MTGPMHDARLRIIDANANRAREALRVIEDIARFVLNDAVLAGDIKALRHSLHAALAAGGFDHAALLAWRDTPGDVGTAISTDAEMHRESLAHVASAACKRLTEALRSIEESIKPPAVSHAAPTNGEMQAGPRPAVQVEAMRYAAYEVERRLLIALPAGDRVTPQWRLCVLITESLCEHVTWDEAAAACIEAGADCLQLREKNLDDRELLDRARRLVSIARAAARPDGSRPAVIINDRPDIALLAQADGVHLGQSDLHISDVHKLVGRRLMVGVSTGSLDQARQAVQDGADYIGVGPMFPTTTKHKPVIAGPGLLAEVLAAPGTAGIPHLAIGGISPQTIGELRSVGCRGVAVSSAVLKEQRPAVACRALLYGFAPTH